MVVYRFDEEAVDEGDALVEELLAKLVERRRAGTWPGLDEGEEQLLTLPRWAVPDMDGADDLGIKFGSGDSAAEEERRAL